MFPVPRFFSVVWILLQFFCSFRTNKNRNNRFVYSFRRIASCVYYYKRIGYILFKSKRRAFFAKEQGYGSINYEIKDKTRFLLLKVEIRVTIDSNSRHVCAFDIMLNRGSIHRSSSFVIDIFV